MSNTIILEPRDEEVGNRTLESQTLFGEDIDEKFALIVLLGIILFLCLCIIAYDVIDKYIYKKIEEKKSIQYLEMY